MKTQTPTGKQNPDPEVNTYFPETLGAQGVACDLSQLSEHWLVPLPARVGQLSAFYTVRSRQGHCRQLMA